MVPPNLQKTVLQNNTTGLYAPPSLLSLAPPPRKIVQIFVLTGFFSGRNNNSPRCIKTSRSR